MIKKATFVQILLGLFASIKAVRDLNPEEAVEHLKGYVLSPKLTSPEDLQSADMSSVEHITHQQQYEKPLLVHRFYQQFLKKCVADIRRINAEEGTEEYNTQFRRIVLKLDPKACENIKTLFIKVNGGVLVGLMDVFRDLAGKLNHLQPADFQANPALELIRDVLELRDIFTDHLNLNNHIIKIYVLARTIGISDLVSPFERIAYLLAQKQKAEEKMQQYLQIIQAQTNNKAIHIAESLVQKHRRNLDKANRQLELVRLLYNFCSNLNYRAYSIPSTALRMVLSIFMYNKMLQILYEISPNLMLNYFQCAGSVCIKFLPERICMLSAEIYRTLVFQRAFGNHSVIFGDSMKYGILNQEQTSIEAMAKVFALTFPLNFIILMTFAKIEQAFGFNDGNLALE